MQDETRDRTALKAPDDWFSFGVRGDWRTFDQIESTARERLSEDVWDFLEGGSGREATLRANLSAWEEWHLIPRALSGCPVPELGTEFLGIPLTLPLLGAPVGGDGLLHPEGQRAIARANQRAGVASIAPEASSFSLEEIAEAAPEAARIMQLHPVGEEGNVVALARRAQAAGYTALCVTVDCPVNGWRERNLRNGFEPDMRLFTGNYPPEGGVDPEDVFGELLRPRRPAWTWEKLSRVLREVGLPWIAKGILTADDALAAVAAGASAIVVSNHGGRQLDSAPPAIRQLPGVAAAVAGQVPIGVDGGIRYGTNIIKAIALGADVVVVGRAVAYAVAAGGEDGVLAFYDLLRREMEAQMMIMGCGDLDALGPEVLQAR